MSVLAAMRAWVRRFPLLRRAVHRVSPHGRALRAIARDHPGRLLQPSADTRPDRYPAIFDFIAAHLQGRPAPRLLCYGCSTGEELLAMRRRLPNAHIVGADINGRSLARARRLLRRHDVADMALRQVTDPTDLAPDPFDAVLCLAVLRHGDLLATEAPSCAAILPFARAEAVATALAARVRPGGLLALWCTQFRFEDMGVSAGFEPALTASRGDYFNHPLYGRNDCRLDGACCSTAVFRRR